MRTGFNSGAKLNELTQTFYAKADVQSTDLDVTGRITDLSAAAAPEQTVAGPDVMNGLNF